MSGNLVNARHDIHVSSTLETRLIETAFPFRDVSLILHSERRTKDPVYSAHRWWARRPPAAMRALLLAMAMPAETPLTSFWELFDSSTDALLGKRVHDPFTGGGSTLVEAARLGATVSGTDVDPLAVEIARHSLEPIDEEAVRIAGTNLIDRVSKALLRFYPQIEPDWYPLHYFYLSEVRCTHCHFDQPLYKDLILARDLAKHGGVQRDHRIVAFCPECFKLHCFTTASRREVRCCKKRFPLHAGNYFQGKLTCTNCGGTSTHREMKTGVAQRRMIAVEETKDGSRRRIRPPLAIDTSALAAAETHLRRTARSLALPKRPLTKKRSDSRPLSFGISHPCQMFTARQLLTFGNAFRRLNADHNEPTVRRALRLILSNALATNNKLCSYAIDYGRLAPLFSVRSYSLPWLSVELNPFHASAGRGTLTKCLERLLRAARSDTRRFASAAASTAASTPASIICSPASDLPPESAIDIAVFDPPYYDYIPYHELSEFFRAWLPHGRAHTPLYPDKKDPIASFAKGLSDSLRAVIRALRPGVPLAFTYHSANPDAWAALGQALDASGLTVTAIWPVMTDSHMGHHTAEGNCEWDAVIVCRPTTDCVSTSLTITIAQWVREVSPLFVSKADQRALSFALEMARNRFGKAR